MRRNLFPKADIQVLRDHLRASLYIRKDRDAAEHIISLLEHAPVTLQTRSAYAGLLLLLAPNPLTRTKYTQRMSTAKVHMDTQALGNFSAKQTKAIVRSSHLMQLTDGCTVACSWCYLNAQPFVRYGATFSSIRRIFSRYGKDFPAPLRFYWASDPLDWYDGEYSYPDVLTEFHTVTDGKTGVVTTTSLPLGTEFTFIRLIQWFDSHLSFRTTRDFTGEAQHYLKNDVMKGLYYAKQAPPPADRLFDYQIKNLFYYGQPRHVLKVSETDANYRRLRALFALLSFIGIRDECLSWIEVETRDVAGSPGIRKSGRAYGWDNRDVSVDAISMACWDSAILFPGKVGAMEMCGVTSETKRGLEFWLVEPEHLVLPRAMAITNYAYYRDGGRAKSYLLPYLTRIEYAGDAIRKKTIHASLKRDIQAFGLLLTKTMPMLEFIARATNTPLSRLSAWTRLRRQYAMRRRATRELLAREKNAEVAGLVRHFMAGIEEKLNA